MKAYKLYRTKYLYPFGEMIVFLTVGEIGDGRAFHEYYVLSPRNECTVWPLRTRFDKGATEVAIAPLDEDQVFELALKAAKDRIYNELVQYWNEEGNLRMVPDSIPMEEAGLGELVGMRMRDECEDALRYVRDSTRLPDLRELLKVITGITVAKTEEPET